MTGSDEEFRQKLLATFRDEADEYLGTIVQGLIDLEKAGLSPDPVILEQVYRKVHSLKGAARAVNLKEIGILCQNLENVFYSMKLGIYVPDEVAYDTFHRALKVIKTKISGDLTRDEQDSEFNATIRDLEGITMSIRKEPGPGTRSPPDVRPIPSDTCSLPAYRLARGQEFPSQKTGTISSYDNVTVSPENAPGPIQNGITNTPPFFPNTIEGTVRIAASRLDSLIAGSDDLLTTRLFITHRSDELEELMTRFSLWRWNKTLVSSDLHRIRKFTHDRAHSVLPADLVLPLQSVMESIQYDHDFIRDIQHALSAHIRAIEQDSVALEASTSSISELIHDAVMLPVSSFLKPFSGFVREYSREMGKKVDFIIEGGEIEIDRRILNALKDPLLHLINNCIDHGIEYPDIRTIRKKPVRGIIRIRIIPLSGTKVGIEVSDDGNGINCELIRAAAVREGIITRNEAEKLIDKEVIWLIFHSGLSVKPSVTDISGRGLGLAIVEETITRFGGNVSVSSVPDSGTVITLWVPIRLATLRGVVVQSGNQMYVIPMKQVRQVIRIRPDTIRSVNNRAVITVQKETIGVIQLASALGIEGRPFHTEGTGNIPVIILGYGAGKIACIVDRVIREQEIVIRSLGSQLRRVKRITGAVILGDGTVALVIDPIELIQEALTSEKYSPVSPGSPKPYKVLVVEDSVTSRSLLQTILEKEGCEVLTADDGIDAFSLLKDNDVDLVVSDVDMPRMNGFTLTEKIRADSRLARVPVVLVTSLDSPEDEKHGYAVGADAYVIKSSFERRNFISLIRRFIPE